MLINDLTTLRIYLKLHADFDFDAGIKSDLKDADELYILDPVTGIGRPLYDELVALVSGNEKQETVLSFLRTATAKYAYTLYARGAAVQHTNAGISVAKGENSAPVSDAKLEGIINDALKAADRFMELALAYLEDNAGDFPTWKNSPAYTARRETLIASVVEFEQYQSLERSRRMFLKLRPLILQGEAEMIRADLGEDLFAILKAGYQANNLAPTYARLLEYAQRVLAAYALGHHLEKGSLLETAEKHRKGMVDYLRKNRDQFPALPDQPTYGRAFPNDPASGQFVF